MHKSINVAIVFLTFILSVTTAAWASKDVKNLEEFAYIFGINLNDNIGMLYRINIAMAVITAALLIMAIGAFHYNTKLFGIIKLIFCVATLILSAMSIAYGSKLTGLQDSHSYGKTGIAAGAFGVLAVGSCTITALKMLMK